MPAPQDREKALDAALGQIDRQFGKGSIMRLGDEGRAPIEVIPTGSIALDVALGIGGLPRGRVVEIYGPESSGKTTVALHAVANAQTAGGIAAFIDAEHALDPEYAKKLGVDTDALLVSQPDTGEQALEIADMLIRSGALDIIVIDSVAALVPRAEIEGEMGDSHVGLQARLMSPGAAQDHRCAQHVQHHGDLHQPAAREDRRHVRLARDHDRWQGAEVLRLGAPGRPPHRDAQGRHRGGRQPDPRQGRQEQGGAAVQAGRVRHHLRRQGISREGGLIDMGVEHGFVRKSGAWYTYEGDQLGQGKENARSFLRTTPTWPTRSRRRSRRSSGSARGSTHPRTSRRPSTSEATHDRSGRAGGGGAATSRPSPAQPALDLDRTRSRWRARSSSGSLTGAARSRAQLADAMARKDVPDVVAEKVLDRFTEVGLIDDEEFARMLVRTRHAERGLSRRAIAVELRRKGIDDELAGAALEEVDGDDEEAAARALVRRKLAGDVVVGRADARAAHVSRRSDARGTRRDWCRGSSARSSRP